MLSINVVTSLNVTCTGCALDTMVGCGGGVLVTCTIVLSTCLPNNLVCRSDIGCWERSRDAVKMVVKSKAFFFFDLAVHAVNLVFLMSIHFPQIPEYDVVISEWYRE